MPEELDSRKKLKTTLIKHKKLEEEASPAVEEPSEKKKVVVVKKKVVVVAKKTVQKPQSPVIEPAKEAPTSEEKPELPVREAQRVTPAPAPAPSEEPPRVQNREEKKQEQAPVSVPRPAAQTPTAPRPAAAAPRPAAAATQPAAQRQNAPSSTAQKPAPRIQTPSAPAGADTHRPRFIPADRGAEPRPSVRESVREKMRLTPLPPRPAGAPPRTGPGGPPMRGGPRPGGRPPARSPAPGAAPGGPARTEDKKPPAKKFFSKAKKKIEYPKRKHDQPEEKYLQVKKKTVVMANPVPKEISITEGITVSELARKMNLKGSDIIQKLMGMGMMVTINQQIDSDTASLLAAEYDCKVNVVSLYDETVIEEEKEKEEDLKPRPPIVTIMGHVDHGKTKLLDAIRSANVAEGEYGGITQHIGAYTVDLPQGRIVFLDTPGHEAFTMMRARGAQVTDIVVLVVSAVDGVMPQTVEAINHAKQAHVPIIVAVNKVDLAEANVDLVKKQLTEHGLAPEDWGGTTIYNEVSALKKTGIKELLESILLQSEILELRASYSNRASGIVLESRVDMGRGIVATVILQRGTLKAGDSFVAGIYSGKVRAIFNDRGEKVVEATPSLPVEVIGFTSIPNAGDPFQVTDSEQTAKTIGSKRQELKKLEEMKSVKKVTLDNLYEQIKEGQIQELKVIIKADVAGSVEALKSSLERLSTQEIKLEVIQAAAGAINEGDVLLASASNALIVGFHVRPSAAAQSLADREKVEIRKYNIIYDALEDIRSAMEGMLKPELREEQIGTIEVRNTFKIPKIGTIAGCFVVSGKVRRGSDVRLIRDGVELWKGKISSLKRFKDDAREVESGFECGIGLEGFHDIKEGDTVEAYETHELARKLEGSRDGGSKASAN
ncbi:MAG TPA: translation initiation factor IF-2 [Spirochaetia bacterium]|nr:translation initiation factor IF-2 [Spirochaetia bacterium]